MKQFCALAILATAASAGLKRDIERAAEDVEDVMRDPERALGELLEDLECEWAKLEPRTQCKKRWIN